MTQNSNLFPSLGRGPFRRFRALFLALAILPVGCGGPDQLGTFDRVTGNIPRPEKVRDARQELGQAGFPNLSSVPDVAPEPTAARERRSSLAALAGREDETTGEADKLHVADIYFPEGSAALDSQDWGILRSVAELLNRRGGRLRLVGHTAGAGPNDRTLEGSLASFEISLARANSVAEALLGLGVARGSLLIEARSDSQPAYRENTEAGVAANRRVEIYQEPNAAAGGAPVLR